MLSLPGTDLISASTESSPAPSSGTLGATSARSRSATSNHLLIEQALTERVRRKLARPTF
jgi:hypothetical protein